MLDSKYLKTFEKKIIESNEKELNKDFISNHFDMMLKFIKPIIVDNKMKINNYQYKILSHLFNLVSNLDYIPSL